MIPLARSSCCDLLPRIAQPGISFYGAGGVAFGAMYPTYVRGMSYVALGKADEAATEFQKILEHPGVVLEDPMGALARLQLARAWTTAGDVGKAKRAYEELLRRILRIFLAGSGYGRVSVPKPARSLPQVSVADHIISDRKRCASCGRSISWLHGHALADAGSNHVANSGSTEVVRDATDKLCVPLSPPRLSMRIHGCSGFSSATEVILAGEFPRRSGRYGVRS
jgi:hypothetical protein